uniref:Uncharacterized protein n=1 Tax=Oryza brachyantha TaxID=4533 RepID=J3MEW0_ORYBR
MDVVGLGLEVPVRPPRAPVQEHRQWLPRAVEREVEHGLDPRHLDAVARRHAELGKLAAMAATRPARAEVQGLELGVLVLHHDAEKFPPPPPRMAQK